MINKEKLIVNIGKIEGVTFSLETFSPKDKIDAKEFNLRCAKLLSEINRDLVQIYTAKVKS